MTQCTLYASFISPFLLPLASSSSLTLTLSPAAPSLPSLLSLFPLFLLSLPLPPSLPPSFFPTWLPPLTGPPPSPPPLLSGNGLVLETSAGHHLFSSNEICRLACCGDGVRSEGLSGDVRSEGVGCEVGGCTPEEQALVDYWLDWESSQLKVRWVGLVHARYVQYNTGYYDIV